MALMQRSSGTSTETPSSTEAPDLTPDLAALQDAKRMAELASWVKREVEKARTARTSKQVQWKINMAMFFGQHWVQRERTALGLERLSVPRKPRSVERKTINRLRAVARSEMSRYLSQTPNAVAVPSTAEDQDQRAALAAEQVWLSNSTSQKLGSHFAKAVWWDVVCGTGYIKTEWDNTCIDKVSKQKGVIKYSAPTPFHIFVPDIRETDIEDQPYYVQAIVKPVEWVKRNYAQMLGDRDLRPSVASQNTVLEGSTIALGSSAEQTPDSVILYETWIKPGGHDDFPDGGLVLQVDDIVLNVVTKFPYAHGLYPIAKIVNIPTNTFYGDSVLNDLVELQKEYNTLRSEISDAGKKMGRPQLLAVRGSIVPAKVTNEAGLIIEVKAGYPMPQPLSPVPLPQYYLEQQDRLLTDIEDLSGQHEVSRGQAPAGITAGTAINYLQEKDNEFFAPQYQSIEEMYEKVAISTVELFVQYVPMPRKIKIIGADQAFDTQLLSASDVASGTDIRIEPGSSVGQSQAAKEAKVMDMFGMGLIDQNSALRLMEVGGAQKILDILSAAEKKAQRENMKMKMLKPEEIMQAEQEYQQATQQMGLDPSMFAAVGAEVDTPMASAPADPTAPPPPPPLVQVADFDVHEIHIDVHNKFRMSQEYEILPPEVQQQFDKHVKDHEQKMIQKQMMSFLQMIPSDGSDGEDPNAQPTMDVETPGAPGEVPGESETAEGEPATMPPGGAAPAPMPTGV